MIGLLRIGLLVRGGRLSILLLSRIGLIGLRLWLLTPLFVERLSDFLRKLPLLVSELRELLCGGIGLRIVRVLGRLVAVGHR